jgi:hypothetical protein
MYFRLTPCNDVSTFLKAVILLIHLPLPHVTATATNSTLNSTDAIRLEPEWPIDVDSRTQETHARKEDLT